MINTSDFSDSGLLSLHLAVLNALKADDETHQEQEKLYSVRTKQDWRRWSDSLETELTKRNIPFNKVPW